MADKAASAVLSALEALRAGQARQEAALSTIESRVAMIHDQLARVAETATRLKLMADNSKRLGLAHAEAIKAV